MIGRSPLAGRTALDVTDEEIAKAKADYWPHIMADRELADYVRSLDEPNERFFWAYLVAHEDEELEMLRFEHMRAAVERKVRPSAELSPTPFSDARRSISPGGFFRTSEMIGRWL